MTNQIPHRQKKDLLEQMGLDPYDPKKLLNVLDKIWEHIWYLHNTIADLKTPLWKKVYLSAYEKVKAFWTVARRSTTQSQKSDFQQSSPSSTTPEESPKSKEGTTSE